MIHANTPTIDCFVEKQFLYDMDPAYKSQYQKCAAFALASYPGEALTYTILLDNGSVFSYIPFHALRKKPEKQSQDLELSDLVYRNCPGEDIVIHTFDHLKGPVQCYFRKKNLWLPGTYLYSVDWYKANELFHVIQLDQGQYAALPSHKIKFRNNELDFEQYKKLHQTWRI